MFFPDRIRSIRAGDRVLDVGPGSQPHPAAHVYLERRFDSDAEAQAQSGGMAPRHRRGRTVLYDGGRFPFADHAFDYVVCSHVLEHVPAAELPIFVAELQRVAGRGYLEFPTVFYELFNWSECHQWLLFYSGTEIRMLPKQGLGVQNVCLAYRSLFFGGDTLTYSILGRYPGLFFCGFEWRGSFAHRIVQRWDELVDQPSLEQTRRYLADESRRRGSLRARLAGLVRRCLSGSGCPRTAPRESQ
jgi:hypothetical protein